jgi:hypothetical protein
LAQRFGGRATLVSGGLVARQALFAVGFYTKWYLTTTGRDKEVGLFQVRWPLELSVLPPETTLFKTTKSLSVQQQRLD